jgi:hypothetical protein
MTVLLVLAGVAVLLALAVVPVLLPWPKHLRWLIAVTAIPDPWGLVSTPWPGLQEVVVETVTEGPGCLLVWVAGLPPARLRVLTLRGATPDTTAVLDGWAIAGTPLLEVPGLGSGLTLCGPTRSVGGLQALPCPPGPLIRTSDAPAVMSQPMP